MSLLGQGGMAEVFQAYDESLRRPVAIKVLHNDILSREDRARFSRECKIIALLNHPYFVRVYQCGITSESRPYVVMEYIKGCTLTSWLGANDGKMECTTALKLGSIICNALAYAHKHGIVHRDINPNNILLEDGDPLHPKIIDFGLSFIRDGIFHNTYATQSGHLLGTPHYLSPEQCDGRIVDGRSDIYAFGCTLYKCISGSTVFTADNAIGLVYKHLNEAPKLESLSESVLLGVDKILLLALAKDPNQRYQTAEQVAEDIQVVLAGRAECVRGVATSLSSGVVKSRFPWKVFGVATLAATISLGLVIYANADPGLTGFVLSQSDRFSLSADQRAALLNHAATVSAAINKPLAEKQSYRKLFETRALVAALPPRLALGAFQRYSDQVAAVSNQLEVTADSELISSFIEEYLRFLASILKNGVGEEITNRNGIEISDKELSQHLRNVHNLVPLTSNISRAKISFRHPAEVYDLVLQIYESTHKMPMSTQASCELLLVLSDQDGDPWRRASALRRLAKSFKETHELALAHAYYNQCFVGYEINHATLTKEEYQQLLQELWEVDYRLGMPLHALDTGRRAISNGSFSGEGKTNFMLSYGGLLSVCDEYAGAVKILQPLLEKLHPSTYEQSVPKYMLAKAYLCTGEIDLARHWLTQVKPSTPVEGLWCAIELADGNQAVGLSKLAQWSREQGSSQNGLENIVDLANTLMVLGLNNECEELCKVHLNLQKPDTFSIAILLFRLAQCSFNQGKFSRAEELCNRSLSIPIVFIEHQTLERLMLMTKLMQREKHYERARCFARLALPLSLLRHGSKVADSQYLMGILKRN